MIKLFYLPASLLLIATACTRHITMPIETVMVRTDTMRIATARSDTLMWRDSVVIVERGDTLRKEVWHTRENTKWRIANEKHSHCDTVVREIPVAMPSPKESVKIKTPTVKERIENFFQKIATTLAMIFTIIIMLKFIQTKKK